MSALQDKISARGILTVSKDAVMRVLASENGDAALVLLDLMAHDSFDPFAAAARLGFDEERMKKALGVIDAAVPESEAPKKPSDMEKTVPAVATLVQYSGQELAQAMADEKYAFLCAEAERCLRRPLRRHECETLLALYEDAGIDAEILAMLLTYMTRRAQRALPDGAAPRLSFARVREEAMRWYENGVDSAEKAEVYIRQLDELESDRSRVQKILGISGRKPSPTELRYIDQFIEIDPSFLLIAKAYDITMVNRGALVWPYMRTILAKWHDKGYKTPDDVEIGEAKRGRNGQGMQGEPKTGSAYENEVLDFLKNNGKGV